MSYTYPAFSYDDSQIDELLSITSADKLKVCDACGKLFRVPR